MSETKPHFFWGVLLGAAAAALAGAVALSRSFRSSTDGGRTMAPPARRKSGSSARRSKPSTKR